MKNILIVGAGTAGCVVASALSEVADWGVLLLEAGVDRLDEPPANVFQALASCDSSWPQLRVHEAGASNGEYDYVRGRGTGGSSAVNGTLCAIPPLEDFDAWADITKDAYWGGQAMETTFASLSAQLSSVAPSRWGRADKALSAFAATTTHSDLKTVSLAVDATTTRRKSPSFELLSCARNRPNLSIGPMSEVGELLVERHGGRTRVTGVQLLSGATHTADHVVLCAGAIGSPTLLLRAAIGTPGVGTNLRNHVGVLVTLHFSQPESIDSPVTSIALQTPDFLRILPLNTVNSERAHSEPGALLAYAMRATQGQGTVTLDNRGQPAVTFATTSKDRSLLRDAFRVLDEAARCAIAEGAATSCSFDETTNAKSLLRGTDEQLDDWLASHRAPIYHAAGTCRMGTPEDPWAVVDASCTAIGVEGLSIIDASVFPTLPAAEPNLTVTAMAVKATHRLIDKLHRDWPNP